MTRWSSSADAVVIGCGLTAGAVLARLAELAKDSKILVLDKGSIWDPEREPPPTAADMADLAVPQAVDHVILSQGTTELPTRKWWSAARAGGGSLLWYGQMSRFSDSDLGMATLFPGVEDAELRDWPIDFAELRSAYTAIESILRPYGSHQGYSEADYGRMDCEVWRPRARISHFELRTLDALRGVELSPYVGQTCLGGRTWEVDPAVPEVRGVAAPPAAGVHPLLLRPNWYTQLPALAQRSGIRTVGDAFVTSVIVGRGHVRGVEYRSMVDGSIVTHRVRSGVVVLAASPLDSIRILLASELPNRNAAIGRGFTMTQERVAYFPTSIERSTQPHDVEAGRYANVTIKDFYDLPGRRPLGKGGKISMYDALLAELPDRHRINVGIVNAAELQAFVDREQYCYTVKASFKGESVPWSRKHVTLAAHRNMWGAPVAQLHYEPHPADAAVQEAADEAFRLVADALGSSRPLIHPVPSGPGVISAHHHGGARFGSSARDSVLDRWCEVFEAEGLFVVDGSFMPTSGATNSSLTSMANAWRVAPAVAARM